MGWEEFEAWRPFKKPAKDKTSTYPLFSNALDEVFDLKSAWSQYAFYASFLVGIGFVYSGLRKRAMFEKIKVTSVVSKFNRHSFPVTAFSLVWTGTLVPIGTGLVLGVMHSKQRNEEVDKTGSRFRQYMRNAVYAGLDEQTAAILARDIVIRSTTFAEGQELLELALSRRNELEQLTKDIVNRA